VLKNVSREKFYCPGSLLRVRVDNTHPLGYGLPDEVAGYFARSSAFETGARALEPQASTSNAHEDGGNATTSPTPNDADIETKVKEQPVTTVARYADNIVLLSGWVLGEEWIRNRGAVCEVQIGDGRVVLLGFRVQHRGQPWSTFKLLFNGIYRSTLADPS